MKAFWGALIIILFSTNLSAQYIVKGQITQQGQPVDAASLSVLSGSGKIISTVSKPDGTYEFTVQNKRNYTLNVQHINMLDKRLELEVVNPITVLNIELEASRFFLTPVEVTSIRASDRAPFTKTNFQKEQIEKGNLGQDLPFLLNQTPNIVVNSDAGNGVGYTGMRIRGSDATRINMTINGIPYNDPESQGVFLVNLPDFASSITSLQIQRGVGTSSNGAGAFGATLNISTHEFNPAAYAEFNNSYGSFNTRKHTIKVGSGLLKNHFTIDARLSQITSDGFIDRASSNLQSYYLSTAYTGKKTSLRFNTFSGSEKTYQAWYGVPENLLSTNRTYNSAGSEKGSEPYDNETDNYKQDHYQLFFNQALSDYVNFNTALFLVKGKGYYEQYKADAKFSAYGKPNPIINGAPVTSTDLVRQLWLDNNFYGQIASINYKKGADIVTLGGGWNGYKGQHFGKVIWAQTGIPKDHEFYRNEGEKKDANVYTKWQHALNSNWELFADIQYRHVKYRADGFRNNPGVSVNQTFNFINPKAGITYLKGNWQAYFSYALGNKEPNREDFEAGILLQPVHESMDDFELGAEYKTGKISWGATAYYMRYKNQLILTGQVNDVGAYTRVNVPKSYRLGLELQGNLQLNKYFSANANVAISRNKIATVEEYFDNYDNGNQEKITHLNPDISFSPSVVAGATLNIIPIKNAEINLLSKYVSKQYLDNTENNERSLDAYFVQDLRLSYMIQNKFVKNVNIIAQVNNLFNNMYEANGYTFSYRSGGTLSTENYYFPMAGINYMVGLSIKL